MNELRSIGFFLEMLSFVTHVFASLPSFSSSVATQSSLTGVVFRAVGMMYLVDLDDSPVRMRAASSLQMILAVPTHLLHFFVTTTGLHFDHCGTAFGARNQG